MGFRIHFGCADLARTTIGRKPDPLWEVLLGMHMLQTDDEPAVFGAWRQRAQARLTALERELLVLAPPVGYSPDFLTPAESADGLETGLAAVAATPLSRLESELSRPRRTPHHLPHRHPHPHRHPDRLTGPSCVQTSHADGSTVIGHGSKPREER